MRHIFILNPAAGKKQAAISLLPEIEAFFKAHPMDYTVYITTAPGEATELARKECEKGDPVRLYACGGDGTVLEVANGMCDCDHAELACVPCGSGNDFLRFLPNAAEFRNLPALINGTARKVDAISCNGSLALNMCSMGVDADVASRMSKYKHLPGVTGPMAYNLALVNTFCRPIGQQLRIVIHTENGVIERSGKYLFALAANGQYYGGGYHGSPLSQIDDGKLDFILVKKVSHLKVLTILGKYKRGEHLDLPCCESFSGTAMEVYADKPAIVNADGECVAGKQVELRLLPNYISFVYPCKTPEKLLNNYEKSVNSQKVT